jgi:hypothetical protein
MLSRPFFMAEFTAKTLSRKEERCHKGHREEPVKVRRKKDCLYN